MPDQAPPAPEGCVYGPWWDGSYGMWLAVLPLPSDTLEVKYWSGGKWCWGNGEHESAACWELLRLAKENAEMRDTMIMASAVTAKLNEVNAELTAEVEKMRLKEFGRKAE